VAAERRACSSRRRTPAERVHGCHRAWDRAFEPVRSIHAAWGIENPPDRRPSLPPRVECPWVECPWVECPWVECPWVECPWVDFPWVDFP
jgi:hypothetical protein